MADVYKGNGVTYTFSGITLDVVNVELPGFEKAEIDITNLTNSAYKTAITAALAKVNDFALTVTFDPAEYVNIVGASDGTFKITFTGGANITFYAAVKSVGNVTFENGVRPTYTINFLITNWNGSAETAPAYSAV